MNLAEEQEKMKERWSSRRRVSGPLATSRGKFKTVNDMNFTRLVPSDYADKSEIEILSERTDLKCPTCKKNNSKVSKLTGQLKECTACKARNAQLQEKYGLTRQGYETILFDQKGVCAICSKEMKKPSVDHCHDLGHVRGILCLGCNTLLGLAGDDELLLKNAVKYLNLNRLERNWSVKHQHKINPS